VTTTPAGNAPVPGRFLSASWRFLALINYEIDGDVLRPFVPRGILLDAFEGRTYVSVVGFRFLDTRVLGMAIPFHRDFNEINLRFYVRRLGPEGWRRGVVFIREIVPRRAIALVARAVYNEPYVSRRMSHRIDLPAGRPGSGLVEYAWHEGARRSFLRARTRGVAEPPVPGSAEEFITEHYWGYARQRDSGCVEYRVEHVPWNVWQTTEAELDCDVARSYGAPFSACLGAAPSSAFVADGSPVVVRHGVRIP
jgi:uncharacterized protein YqjF (DUF2071 family)